MSDWEIFLTAVSLSLDAVAVAVAAGTLSKIRIKQALKIAAFFGGFQFMMPLIGWGIGYNFTGYLKYGNVIGFVALLLVGIKMLAEAIKKTDGEDIEKERHITQLKILILLAITTSIDALIIGLTFNFIKVNVWSAVSIIGLVTFFLSLIGVYLGERSKKLVGNRIEIFGSLILIILAFKILLF